MSLLTKGITRLSQLQIDADKDWQGKGVTNLGGLAAGMDKGHIVQHNGSIMETLSPSVAHQVLTSMGVDKLVGWAPGGAYFFRYFPESIALGRNVATVAPDEVHGKEAAITTLVRHAYGDAPSDYIKRLTPAVALVDEEVMVAPDETHNKDAAIASIYETSVA